MTMGARIRKAREDAGKTQKEIAHRFGISRNAVSLWESDETRPRTKRIEKLAEYLGGVSVVWLISGEEENDLGTLEMLHGFNQLPPDGKQEILRRIRLLLEAYKD